jgi:flagellar motor switch protein FliN/FliY
MADEREFGVKSDGSRSEMEAVLDVKVEVFAILGTAEMPISQILKLGRGAVVELERFVGEDIELHANNELIAKGEIIVVDDRLGVTVTDVIKRPSG